MDKKEPIKIGLSTVLLIMAIIIIIAMGCYIVINNSNITKEMNSLKSNISQKQDTIETIKDNNTSNTTNINNSTNSSKVSNSVSSDDTISYEINKLTEGRVNVKATKNGKSTSKDFEMDAMIDKTGTIKIENIGEVELE